MTTIITLYKKCTTRPDLLGEHSYYCPSYSMWSFVLICEDKYRGGICLPSLLCTPIFMYTCIYMHQRQSSIIISSTKELVCLYNVQVYLMDGSTAFPQRECTHSHNCTYIITPQVFSDFTLFIILTDVILDECSAFWVSPPSCENGPILYKSMLTKY